MNPPEYYFYPNLANAARATGRFKTGFRGWLALHHKRPRGGTLSSRDVRGILCNILGITDREAYYIMKIGHGRYWDYAPGGPAGGGTVRIYKLREACESFGLTWAGAAIRRPLDDLSDRKFLALTYELSAGSIKNVQGPTTQATRARVTNVHVRNQNRYNKILGIEMGKDVELVRLPKDQADMIECLDLCARNSSYYIGWYCVDGMRKAERALFRTAGSHFPGILYENSTEGRFVLLGSRRGVAVWAARANHVVIRTVRQNCPPCNGTVTYSIRAQTALTYHRPDPKAPMSSWPASTEDDDWHPPPLPDLVDLPDRTQPPITLNSVLASSGPQGTRA